MTAPGTAARRLQRGLRLPVFTAATVSLGIGAHLAAGGAAPSASLLALVTAVVALVGCATTGRELRLPALLTAVALTEVGIHVALLGDGHTMHGPGAPPAAMTAAHLVASVLLACWLRRGEAAIWRTVIRAVRLLDAAHRGRRLPPTPVLRVSVRDLTRPLLPQHTGVVRPVRGPPVAA